MKLALLLYGTNPNSISVDINRQINSELGFFICPDIIDGVRYWCRYESWLYGDTRLIGYYE